MSSVPLSVYLDLEDGQVADLEVVARASLAFAAAVKDVAYIVDPTLDIRIELASGSEGSLSLNSILRNLKDHKGEAITLGAVAFIILNWLGGNLLDYGFDMVMDAITGSDQSEQHFTPEQRQELADIVTKAVEGRVAQEHVQRFYREVERDPAIRGVGATPVLGEKPHVIVPRSEFPARAGRGEPRETTINRRVTTERVRVLLVSPVLLPGNRRWKLRSSQGEFGASIKDADFVARVLSGTTSVRMKTGIEMDVELETTEEFRHGVWEIIDRSVRHVDNLIEPPSQLDLALFESNEDEAGDNER